MRIVAFSPGFRVSKNWGFKHVLGLLSLDDLEGFFFQLFWKDRFDQVFCDGTGRKVVPGIARAANNYRDGAIRKSRFDRSDQPPSLPGAYFRFDDDRLDIAFSDHFQNAVNFRE